MSPLRLQKPETYSACKPLIEKFNSSTILPLYAKGILEKKALGTYLVYTNIFLATFSAFLGDLIQQKLEANSGGFDLLRNSHLTLAGFTFGLFCHHWYSYLDGKFAGNQLKVVLWKVFCDLAITTSFCVVNLLVTKSVFERLPPEEVLDLFLEKAPRLFYVDWAVSTPAQLFNFYFLPSKLRLAFVCFVDLGLDMFMSYASYD